MVQTFFNKLWVKANHLTDFDLKNNFLRGLGWDFLKGEGGGWSVSGCNV